MEGELNEAKVTSQSNCDLAIVPSHDASKQQIVDSSQIEVVFRLYWVSLLDAR